MVRSEGFPIITKNENKKNIKPREQTVKKQLMIDNLTKSTNLAIQAIEQIKKKIIELIPQTEPDLLEEGHQKKPIIIYYK